MATIRDVALHAGVSSTTVSRYANGRIRLPPETAARIDAAIAYFDYRPNVLARQLASGRTHTIGLVAPRIGSPFFAELLTGVEAEADRHGHAVMVISTHAEGDREIAALNRLRDRHVDGLIMIADCAPDAPIGGMLSSLDRVVIVGENAPGSGAPMVTFENAEGSAQATHHLIEAGHARIAHLGNVSHLPGAQRLAGYRAAMLEAGLHADTDLIQLDLGSRQETDAAVRRMLASRRPPTAFFAASDEATIGAVRALGAVGARVPGDVSIVGFCSQQVCDLAQPPITAVRKPVEALGRSSCRILLDLLSGTTPAPLTRLPVELVPGETVATPARLRATG